VPKELLFNEQELQSIINLYLSGSSAKQIGEKFKCSKQKIIKILKQNKINIRNKSESVQKYNINQNIFNKIDNHEKAYWLGIISGDGHINNRNELVLSLQNKDKYLIYKFREFLNSNHPIKEIINNIKKDNSLSISSAIYISNKQIVSDLKKYGLTHNKTNYMKFPKINKKFLNSYLLGLIDSDGCFCIKNKNLYFNFVGPTEFVKEFQNILINKCGVTKTKLGYNKKTNFIRIIEYNGYKNIFKIVKFIYSNSPIWLERKRKIAFDFLLTKFPKDKFLNNLSFSEVAKTFNCWI
jgi:DNA-binding CsgD family transcriptional regulator